jgi:hypothetical protein
MAVHRRSSASASCEVSGGQTAGQDAPHPPCRRSNDGVTCESALRCSGPIVVRDPVSAAHAPSGRRRCLVAQIVQQGRRHALHGRPNGTVLTERRSPHSLTPRSTAPWPRGGTGRRTGLKIRSSERDVTVRLGPGPPGGALRRRGRPLRARWRPQQAGSPPHERIRGVHSSTATVCPRSSRRVATASAAGPAPNTQTSNACAKLYPPRANLALGSPILRRQVRLRLSATRIPGRAKYGLHASNGNIQRKKRFVTDTRLFSECIYSTAIDETGVMWSRISYLYCIRYFGAATPRTVAQSGDYCDSSGAARSLLSRTY